MAKLPLRAAPQAFATGELPAAKGRRVARRLLRSRTAETAPELRASLEQREAEYDALLARLEAKLPTLIAREETRVRKTVALLRRKGPHKLPGARFSRFVALKAYRELSWELRYENRGQMLELSRLALQEAEHLDVEREIGWKRSRSLAALAWAEVGNALRVNDRFDEAEQAFGMAHHCLSMGTADDRLTARIHNLQSSLYADRAQISLAIGALDVAIAIYQRVGERHLAGSAYISKGNHLSETGEIEQALEMIGKGLALLEVARDPELYYTGVHNFARALLRAGRVLDARAVLSQTSAPEDGGRLLRLRHVWLEGEIAAELGETEAAEKALSQARLGLREAGRPYDSAIVALELASLRFQGGKLAESLQFCLEASEELFGLGIPGEARTAILMLLKAHQVGTATVQLIDGVAGYLRQAESLRHLRGEPATDPQR